MTGQWKAFRKPVSASNRRFALNLTRRAAAMAARSGIVGNNQMYVWRLLVEASHKPRKAAKR